MNLSLPAATVAAVAALLTICAQPAAGAELGMEAPALKVAHWLGGEAVDVRSGRGTNVYVVEFWATWCGPCRVTMPHLTELQKRFKDRNVSVVGVSREPLSTVKPFVGKQGDKLGYTIAVDADGATSAAYMQAFGVGGIPHAFVIDKQGRIAWHGHPMDGLDRVLEDVLADRYDLAAAQRSKGLAASMNAYFGKVLKSGLQSARADGDRVVADAKADPELLNQFAWVILTHPRLPVRDIELASLAARAACDATDGKTASHLDTYAKALSMSGKHADAAVWQEKAVTAAADDAERLRLRGTLEEYQRLAGKN